MSFRRHDTIAGITLIEVLVSLGLMAVAFTLGAKAFVEVIRLRGAQGRYQERLAGADYVLRRIAADVRPSCAFLGSARVGNSEYAAGPDTLILQTPAALVLYHAQGGNVERMEAGAERIARAVVLRAPNLRLSFDYGTGSPAAARSVVATAEWDEPPAIGTSYPVLSLRTALRGAKP